MSYQYENVTDSTAIPIGVVSQGNEFMVTYQGTGTVEVQYDRGDGTYATFASGTLSAAGETVFTAPGSPMQLKGTGTPDAHILVTELKFEQ